jgi:hypothetical protein
VSRLRKSLERRRVVKGRQLHELRESAGNDIVDDRRLAELRAPVHDPVRYGGDIARSGLERLDIRRGSVLGDERELEARRPRVDDEDRVFAQ